MNIEAIICGSSVTLNIGNIEGMITAILIRFDKIQYEFSYFYNGEYRCIWINEKEIKNIPEAKQQIGFNNK